MKLGSPLVIGVCGEWWWGRTPPDGGFYPTGGAGRPTGAAPHAT